MKHLLSKFLRLNFFIRLRHWEYWPFGIVQLPLFLYFSWLALRSRSITFFSAANPGIVMGGMFGESKFDVLRKIPPHYIPRTIRVVPPTSSQQLHQLLEAEGLHFPLIFKPDLGERGFMVQRINDLQHAAQYLQRMPFAFLVQELVDLPLEFGVFYTRLPHQPSGSVTSVVMKEMLSVTGDGQQTLQQLILQKERAKLQWPKLQQRYQQELDMILPLGERKELVSIGNHCLGTTFLDGQHLINDTLSKTFDAISQQIEGFYFGRFDLRCASLDDLYKGRVKILELNGCGAEPAHIYQPGYSLTRAVAVLMQHWRNIFVIARYNVSQGHQYIPVQEALIHYRKFKAATTVER